MEKEAHFLYVAYTSRELPAIMEGPFEVYSFDIQVKRAILRRPEAETIGRQGFRFERVETDFDPCGKQIAYVVILRSKSIEDGRFLYRRNCYFPAITETEEEAVLERDRLLQTKEYKSFLKKPEELDGIEIEPILIASV